MDIALNPEQICNPPQCQVRNTSSNVSLSRLNLLPLFPRLIIPTFIRSVKMTPEAHACSASTWGIPSAPKKALLIHGLGAGS